MTNVKDHCSRRTLRLILPVILAVAGLALAVTPGPAAEAPAGRVVHRIDVEGVIAPATARYILRAIRQAEEARAEALLIRLDTPGGLVKSMDDITKGMLNATVPIIVYVAPEGARAASAGVFITYAAHVAAMAPATRIGAAHPVSIGGDGQGEQQRQDKTLLEKVTNDAVGNIRGIARRRGRNAEWAERAVRESVVATADEALRLGVINLIAKDVDNLLRAINGRTVTLVDGTRRLATAGARVVTVGQDVTEQFLRLLADPNIGFILLNIGIIGVLAELYNPGLILPGVVGAIALILGLASFAIVEVNAAGLLLIALGVVMFIADIKVPGHGVLTFGGVISFIFGAILLTSRQAPFLRISLQLILGVAAALAAFFLFAVGAGMRAQRAVVRSGTEGLVGATGVARTVLDPEGMVYVQGEMWTARAEAGTIGEGARVVVVGLEGLCVRVRPVE
ncbi:MAG: nodulation protein NfeD [Armatimonadetes bacterium]|nr:nodulation protein NfeD [Armatimonadota bacterium]